MHPISGVPIVVTEGSGEAERLADRAELAVTFAGRGPDRAGAVADLGRRLAAARDVLACPALTVRRRRLHVSTEWRGKRPAGCLAQEYLDLLVTDVAEMESVLAALLGTEPAELHGPRWILHDPAAALREAQRGAVEDARSRAQGYAEALAARLGPLVRLDEAPDHGSVRMAMARGVESVSDVDVRDLGLDPEPVRVCARVTTTWMLLAAGS